MQGKNASAIRFITALSPAQFAFTAATTNASNFSGFEWGTIIVVTGSGASANNATANIQRSGTSNGTFATVASLPGFSACQTLIRSFAIDSSAPWYRVAYGNGGAGSQTTTILIALTQARLVPVDVDQGINALSVFSDVIGA